MNIGKVERIIKIILARFKIFKGHYYYEDLVQEGFLLYLKCEKKFKANRASMETFFSKAYRNHLISFFNEKQDEPVFLYNTAIMDVTNDPAEKAEAEELDEKMRAILDKDETEVYQLMLDCEGAIEEKKGAIDSKLLIDSIRKKFTRLIR